MKAPNKMRVFAAVGAWMLFLSMVADAICIYLWMYNGPGDLGIPGKIVWTIVTAFIAIFALYICEKMLFVTEFCKEGVKRTVLGICVRRYPWEKLRYVAITKQNVPQQFAGIRWICFSPKKLNGKKESLWGVRLSELSFIVNDKLTDCIKQYAPQEIWEQYKAQILLCGFKAE